MDRRRSESATGPAEAGHYVKAWTAIVKNSTPFEIDRSSRSGARARYDQAPAEERAHRDRRDGHQKEQQRRPADRKADRQQQIEDHAERGVRYAEQRRPRAARKARRTRRLRAGRFRGPVSQAGRTRLWPHTALPPRRRALQSGTTRSEWSLSEGGGDVRRRSIRSRRSVADVSRR